MSSPKLRGNLPALPLLQTSFFAEVKGRTVPCSSLISRRASLSRSEASAP
ncbi:hypothetical protein ES703_57073 [subsurface metagenome]